MTQEIKAGTTTKAIPEDCMLLSTSDAARLLGVSEVTLRKARWSGPIPGTISGIPYVKLGDRCIRYRLDDLRAYIESKRVTQTPGE